MQYIIFDVHLKASDSILPSNSPQETWVESWRLSFAFCSSFMEYLAPIRNYWMSLNPFKISTKGIVYSWYIQKQLWRNTQLTFFKRMDSKLSCWTHLRSWILIRWYLDQLQIVLIYCSVNEGWGDIWFIKSFRNCLSNLINIVNHMCQYKLIFIQSQAKVTAVLLFRGVIE